MIRFQAKYLRPLSQFKAKLDIRWYLNAILAEPHPQGGAMLVATNGHMLMAIHDAQAVCSQSVLFDPDNGAISAAGKRIRLGTRWVDVNPYTGRLVVRERMQTKGGPAEREIYAQAGSAILPSAEKFPIWRKVIPDFSKLKHGPMDVIQGNYLRKIMDAHPLDSRGGRAVNLWQADEHGPVIVQFSGASEMIAVLMPMRDEMPAPAQFWGSAFLEPAMKEAA